MPDHRSCRSSHRLIALGLCLLLGACAKAHVNVTQSYTGEPLARPTRVLVQDFAINPAEVQLDQGLWAGIGGEKVLRHGGNNENGGPPGGALVGDPEKFFPGPGWKPPPPSS